MRSRLDEVTPLVPQAIAAYQAKITERLKEALGAADDDRVRAELALFSVKVDVHEELDRLRAHLGEVELALGKRGRSASASTSSRRSSTARPTPSRPRRRASRFPTAPWS